MCGFFYFVNSLSPNDAYVRQSTRPSLVQIMLIKPPGTNFIVIVIEMHTFSFKKMHLKIRPENSGHFASVSVC